MKHSVWGNRIPGKFPLTPLLPDTGSFSDSLGCFTEPPGTGGLVTESCSHSTESELLQGLLWLCYSGLTCCLFQQEPWLTRLGCSLLCQGSTAGFQGLCVEGLSVRSLIRFWIDVWFLFHFMQDSDQHVTLKASLAQTHRAFHESKLKFHPELGPFWIQ